MGVVVGCGNPLMICLQMTGCCCHVLLGIIFSYGIFVEASGPSTLV